MIRRPPRSTRTDTLFPTRRSSDLDDAVERHQIEKALQYRLRLIGVARGNAFDHQMMFGRAAGLEQAQDDVRSIARHAAIHIRRIAGLGMHPDDEAQRLRLAAAQKDRKSTRLTSSH